MLVPVRLPVDVEFEDNVRFAGSTRLRVEAERAVCGFQCLRVTTQLGIHGEKTLLYPAFGHAALNGMDHRSHAQGPLECCEDFHWMNSSGGASVFSTVMPFRTEIRRPLSTGKLGMPMIFTHCISLISGSLSTSTSVATG